jgi:dihydroneopterin aldolase
MTRADLRIEGIRAGGKHGANPGEQDRAQEFVVDLEIAVDVGGDSIDQTADYRAVVGAVIEAVEGESVVLLETLAERVADAVATLDGVARVTAIVHKPAAARSLEVGDIAARATVG